MKVLLVDDEMAIVGIMKRAIDWEGIGIDELFVAYNAARAREILLANQVDIMVCDIEMPKESGLDLIRWVRKQGMSLECIILTAYPDFNYAKEAISLQINNYLLKPVIYAELSNTIEDTVNKILRRRAEERYKKVGVSILSDKRTSAKRFLNKLIWEDTPSSEIAKEAEVFALDLNEFKNVDMIVFRCANIREVLEKNGKIVLFAYENVLDELFDDSVNLCIEYSPLIVCSDRSEQQLEEMCESFISVAERYLKSRMSAFVVKNIEIQEISSSFDLLRDVSEISVYDKNRIQFVQKENLVVKPERIIFDRHRWKKLFQVMGRELIEKQAVTELTQAEQEGLLNRAYLKVYQQELLRIYYRINDAEPNITMDLLVSFEQATDSVENMIQWILQISRWKTGEKAVEVKQSEIEKVREFLESHYNEPISREDIEKHMHLNRDYLNRIFKSTTGYSLMEYLQQYRIIMAKKMLAEGSESITQICFMVGYDSPPYFSKVFKKLVGQTPVAYRNQYAALEQNEQKS